MPLNGLFAGLLLKRLQAAASALPAAVLAHVDVAELIRVAVVAAIPGGTPAAVATAVGQAVLANLPAVLPSEAHQAAVTDVVRAVSAGVNAYRSVATQIKALPSPPAA